VKDDEMTDLLDGLPLLCETPPEWGEIAIAKLDQVLVDHAWCEFKAASAGLGMISRFPEHHSLVRPMIALAQEEMLHFRQVTDLLEQRGVELGSPTADPYVKKLRTLVCAEGSGLGGVGDQLILNAFVEARSCERFRLLAEILTELKPDEGDLSEFYRRLAEAEWRHWESFRDLAMTLCNPSAVIDRIEEVARLEARMLESHPLEARMH